MPSSTPLYHLLKSYILVETYCSTYVFLYFKSFYTVFSAADIFQFYKYILTPFRSLTDPPSKIYEELDRRSKEYPLTTLLLKLNSTSKNLRTSFNSESTSTSNLLVQSITLTCRDSDLVLNNWRAISLCMKAWFSLKCRMRTQVSALLSSHQALIIPSS